MYRHGLALGVLLLWSGSIIVALLYIYACEIVVWNLNATYIITQETIVAPDEL